MDTKTANKLECDLRYILHRLVIKGYDQREAAKFLIDIIPDSGMQESVESLIQIYVFRLDNLGK